MNSSPQANAAPLQSFVKKYEGGAWSRPQENGRQSWHNVSVPSPKYNSNPQSVGKPVNKSFIAWIMRNVSKVPDGMPWKPDESQTYNPINATWKV